MSKNFYGTCSEGRVCVCVCVFLCLVHTEDQNTYPTIQVRTFFEREDLLVGPHNYPIGLGG